MKGYLNGRLWNNPATAFLIEDGRFLSFGSDDEVREKLAAADETVDLQGQFVCPGFIDSHLHLAELGFCLGSMMLQNCRSLDDIASQIRRQLDAPNHPAWIIGRGYNEAQLTDGVGPNRDFLDGISATVPICLMRVCGHVLCANSKALELAGIDAHTEVEGGRIRLAEGIVEEAAIALVQQAWPQETVDSLKQMILTGAKECSRFGITMVGSDDFLSVTRDFRIPLDAFEQLSYQEKLPVRVVEQCEFPSLEEFAEFLNDGYTMDVGNDLFRIGPLKLIADGSLGARTAALSRPYADAPDQSGCLLYSQDELSNYVEMAARCNMSTIVHAIGDQALDMVLDVFQEQVLPGNPLHHGIVHCQIMRPDQIQRILAMQLDCYFQSLFIDADAAIMADRVGTKRMTSCYPYKTLFTGTTAANGSDAPVETPNVLKGIQLAVTRRSIRSGAAMNQDECLSVQQALASYTTAGAKALFVSDRLGALAPGYLADFTVLDTDITQTAAEQISDAKVLMTVMNGEEVYSR